MNISEDLKGIIYTVFVIIVTILVIIKVHYNEKRCIEISEKRIGRILEVCKEDFLELSILSVYRSGNIDLIKIKNKKIIEEFKQILRDKTTISDEHRLKFHRSSYTSIKTRKGFFTISIMNRSMGNEDSGVVYITIFDKPDFDVSKYVERGGINVFLTTKYKWQPNCYQIRNDDMITFIREYIEDVIKAGQKNKYNFEVRYPGMGPIGNWKNRSGYTR